MRCRKRRGITLLELVIGITAAGMLVIAGYGGMRVLHDAATPRDDALKRGMLTTTLRVHLERWLASARVAPERPETWFRGVHADHRGSANDALTFATRGVLDALGGETVVHLAIDRDSAGTPRGLLAEIRPSFSGPARRELLDSTVTGLEIRYLSGLHEPRYWARGWISTTVLPTAAEIRLTRRATNGHDVLESLPIQVRLGTAP